MPSEYFREHVYTTFQDDWTAFQVKDLCNIRRLRWANAFPTGTRRAGVAGGAGAAAERELVLHDNVAELYALPRG